MPTGPENSRLNMARMLLPVGCMFFFAVSAAWAIASKHPAVMTVALLASPFILLLLVALKMSQSMERQVDEALLDLWTRVRGQEPPKEELPKPFPEETVQKSHRAMRKLAQGRPRRKSRR